MKAGGYKAVGNIDDRIVCWLDLLDAVDINVFKIAPFLECLSHRMSVGVYKYQLLGYPITAISSRHTFVYEET